jgi:hypothetical protein
VFSNCHKIGGINYRTDSDVDIKTFRSYFFDLFLSNNCEIDVFYNIKKILYEDLTLDLPDASLKRSLFRCRIPDIISNGGFIVPLLCTWKDDNDMDKYLPEKNDVTDIPLLRAPIIRERLAIVLTHPEDVFLFLHAYCVEIWDYRLHRIDIFYVEEIEGAFASGLLERGISRMFQSFLPDFSSIQIHGGACQLKQGTALFLALDGGGKSTAMALAPHGYVLNDDRIILSTRSDEILVEGTPWGSMSNGPRSSPLGGIFLLEKSDRFEIIPCKNKEAVKFLCSENLPYFKQAPHATKIKAFETICRAARAVPTFRIRFAKNFMDWEAVNRVLKIN